MPAPRAAMVVALVGTAVLAQVTVLARLPLPGATPDAVLLAVVSLGLVYGPMTGMVTGFGAGLALDLVPPADHAAGRWALVLCLVGYVAGLARPDTRRSALVPLLVVACCAAGATAGYAALGAILGDPRVTWPAVARLLPTAVLYDVFLTPFLVPVVIALARRVEADPARR